MKKILPIIIGISIGALFAGSLIYASYGNTALGAGTKQGGGCYWDLLANSEWTDWSAVTSCGSIVDLQDAFNDLVNPSEKAVDLYYLIHDKLIFTPEKKALKALADQFGVDVTTADALSKGDIRAAYSMGGGTTTMTQKEALRKAQLFQKDFNNYKEMFDLEAEIETSVLPSEIFSNGDVSDSGFDLVYDLNVIEEILFKTHTEPTVGGAYNKALASPLGNDDPGNGNGSGGSGGSGGGSSSANPAILLGTNKNTQVVQITDIGGGKKIGEIKVGDKTVKAEVLPEDSCKTDIQDPIKDAVNNYNNETGNGNGDDGNGDNGINDNGDNEADNDLGKNTDKDKEKFLPAEKDNWGSVFCPGFSSGQSEELNFSAQSLTGGTDSNAEKMEEAYVKPKVAICFTIEYIKGKVTASADTGCIQCEVEKINSLFDDFMSHSLVPNKVTGTIFESAKCKAGFNAGVDLNLITITAPVETPDKSDLIHKQNIFAEWNKFVAGGGSGYQEIASFIGDLFGEKFNLKTTKEYATQFAFGNPVPGQTQEEVLSQIRAGISAMQNEAAIMDQTGDTANKLTQMETYANGILPELQQMTSFFEKFNEQYQNIFDTCQKSLSKPECSSG